MKTENVRAAAPAYGSSPAPLAASAKLSIGLAALCATASLAGWVLDMDLLARGVSGWPAVKPVTAVWILVTAAAFALLLVARPRVYAAGLVVLAVDALGVLVSMALPEAQQLAGGAMQSYPGSVMLLIVSGIAFVTAPGARLLPAGRLLAVAAAALLFIALIGISFRLLLGRAPLVDVSLPSLIALLCLSYGVGVVRPDRWLLERLTTERPGAVITRRLLPAAFLLPLVIGWIEVAGEGAGFIDSAFGAVLQTVLTMFGLAALVVWGVRRLDRTEAQRDGAERALREAYGELDRRVQERTAALEHANAALNESGALLRGVAEGTPDLMVVKDTHGRVIMANPAYAKAMGRSESEIVGRTDPELLADAALALHIVESDRAVMASDRVERVEEVIQTPEGLRTYLATKSPLRDLHGSVTGVIAVSTDITERKNAELERERLMGVEQRLRLQAERANRAKDEFLAIVSHELRSPLNALRGWGFLLGSAKSPDADLIERATQAIKRNVDHQARLIEDLLDTSRIMSGKLNIERRPVDFVEVVQGAVEGVKQAAAAKRITVELKTERPALALEGDAARLHQIAMNLLSNAVKFTPEAGHVVASVETRAGVAYFAVTDTGCGIEPEFLPQVFDRFTQADTTTTRRHGGLGIGLALVRHLAELHGGNVSAASEGTGKGATFTVCLPLPVESQSAAAGSAQSLPAGTSGGLAGIHIYALDDDPDARDVISLTLRQAGAEVRPMSSGAELIAALDRELPATRPDILLMDLAMPDEDGFGVLKRVRALERSKSSPALPAIAVTAFTEVTRDHVIEQGFTDHVSKPIDPARLILTIRGALRAAVTP